MKANAHGRRAACVVAAAVAALLAGCEGSRVELGGSGDGAEYTILLRSFGGRRHIEDAKLYKRRTEEHAKWTDLFIVHEGDRSALYWDRYPSIRAARTNLRRAQHYRTPLKVSVYARAVVVTLPGKDPGPSQWNLLHAKGVYSVLVAVFFDMPDRDYVGRKRFAVEYCQRLREKGLEAYYYHGAQRSAVTIGAFPETAVRKVRVGNEIQNIPQDPAIKVILRDFPRLGVNGAAERVRTFNPETKRYEFVIQKSSVILIPRRKGQTVGATQARTGDAKSR